MPMSVVDTPRVDPQRGARLVSRGSQVVHGHTDARDHRAVVDRQNQERRVSAVVGVDEQRVGQRRPEVQLQR